MRKKILIASSLFFLLFSFKSVFAEENNETSNNTNRFQIRKESREQTWKMSENEDRKKNLWRIREEQRIKRQQLLGNIVQEKQRLRTEFKEKFSEEKCARIQERVQNRLSLFTNAEGKHTKVYANLVNRINKFIARADEAKLDTSVVKSHLSELENKIAKFKENYAAYAAKFADKKNYNCQRSKGEFKGALLESKTLLKQVHADAAEIRIYVRTVILPELLALKKQMAQMNNNSAGQDDGSANESNNATNANSGANMPMPPSNLPNDNNY